MEQVAKKARKQPDYSRGKIYMIKDQVNGKFYIGSTTQITVQARLKSHELHYREWLNGKLNYRTSFSIISNDDFKIRLLENYPCRNNTELRQREEYWKANMPTCVNQIKAFQTREELLQQERERSAQPWPCQICNTVGTYGHRREHERSQRHLRAVEQRREESERQAMEMEDFDAPA